MITFLLHAAENNVYRIKSMEEAVGSSDDDKCIKSIFLSIYHNQCPFIHSKSCVTPTYKPPLPLYIDPSAGNQTLIALSSPNFLALIEISCSPKSFLKKKLHSLSPAE